MNFEIVPSTIYRWAFVSFFNPVLYCLHLCKTMYPISMRWQSVIGEPAILKISARSSISVTNVLMGSCGINCMFFAFCFNLYSSVKVTCPYALNKCQKISIMDLVILFVTRSRSALMNFASSAAMICWIRNGSTAKTCLNRRTDSACSLYSCWI